MSLTTLLLQIVVVLLAGRVLGLIFQRFGQPSVIAEIAVGILLGPSLLGWLNPWLFNSLFPTGSLPTLGALAQIGLVIFMFLVGLEFDDSRLRGRFQQAVAISLTGILFPMLLGGFFGWASYAALAPPNVSSWSFSLFLAVAMAITAFPVLAKILSEQGLSRTEIGTIALGAAALGDVSAWCVLALVTGLIGTNGAGLALQTVAWMSLYMLVVFLFFRPILQIAFREIEAWKIQSKNEWKIVISLSLALLSAATTEWIGVHALFGAFLVGVIIPRLEHTAETIREQLEPFVAVVLLPLFFAYSGLRTQIGLIHSASDWMFTLIIIFIATIGKFGGTYLASRAMKMSVQDASVLGLLMNTRGLMEIVVLNIGLDLGVIDQRVFAMMIVMALVTTCTTSPGIRWYSAQGALK